MKTETESTTETAGAKPIIRAVEHTPTPWKVSKVNGGRTRYNGLQIISVGGLNVANLVMQLDDKEVANAAFIVLAVNSHADLLEACKLLREWIGGPGQTSHPLVYDSLREEAWEKSSAAIRKAEAQ